MHVVHMEFPWPEAVHLFIVVWIHMKLIECNLFQLQMMLLHTFSAIYNNFCHPTLWGIHITQSGIFIFVVQ